MLPVEQPFKTYTGLDGKALQNGYVYFGQPGQNPITAPVTVYWDAAGTQPAAQPLRTTNGYIVRAGTPANVFFNGSYSELVQDSQQRQVFYARTSDEFSIATLVSSFIAGLSSTSGASMIGWIRTATGAVATTIAKWLGLQPPSVFDFMTDAQIADVRAGTAVQDVTVAFKAAIAHILTVGGDLVIPRGYYRITSTLDVGLPEWTNFDFLVNRTADVTDAIFTANEIHANVVANDALPGVTLRFEEGAFLVADFAPGVVTPVLSYNLRSAYLIDGQIINPSVIAKAVLAGGKYNFNGVVVPQTNKLIGIYAAAGAKVISKPFVSACEHGIVRANAFWSLTSDIRIEWAGGDAMASAQANASVVENFLAVQCKRGLVIEGDAWNARGINTEQVESEITVFRSDCSTLGPGYLEDVSAADGTGKYAVTLGKTANGLEILSTTITGIRVGAARPNKQAFRFWALANANILGCRAYGKTVTYDANSTGVISGSDFSSAAVPAKFTMAGDGVLWPRVRMTGTSYAAYGPLLINMIVPAATSVAAGATYTQDVVLPSSFDTMATAIASITATSGGTAQLGVTTRVIFTTPRKIRVGLANDSAAPIDTSGAAFTLAVFGGQ